MPLRKCTIHVGYEFELDEKVRETLKELIGIDVNSKSIVAIMYTDKNPLAISKDYEMDRWYEQKMAKVEPAYIRSVFVEKTKKKYIVAYLTVGAQHIWTIIYNTTKLAPIQLKKLVQDKKVFEEKILPNRIEVGVKPYKFEDEIFRLN